MRLQRLLSSTARAMSAVLFAAALAACGGNGNDAPIQVIASDLVFPVNPTTAKVLTDRPFTFSAGLVTPATIDGQASSLNLAGPTTLTVKAPAAGTSSHGFVITQGGGTATGTLSFGSCSFAVVASTIAGLRAGSVVRVETCQVTGRVRGSVVDASRVLKVQVDPAEPPATPAGGVPEVGLNAQFLLGVALGTGVLLGILDVDPVTGAATFNGVPLGGVPLLGLTGAN